MDWSHYFTSPGAFDPTQLWPLSWEKLKQHSCYSLWKVGDLDRIETRFLYDFFDSQEIFITVRAEYGYGTEPEGWRFDINGDRNYDGWSDDRETAEHKAFIAAFRELEESLSQEDSIPQTASAR